MSQHQYRGALKQNQLAIYHLPESVLCDLSLMNSLNARDKPHEIYI